MAETPNPSTQTPTPAPTDPPTPATPPTKTTPPANTPAEPNGGEDPKPYLGGGQNANPPPADPNGGGKKPDEKPEGPTDDDYAKALVKDEALLGSEKELTFDTDMFRKMAPAFREAGIAPEAANKLANALARIQMDDARERMKARQAHFDEMKQASLRKYSEADFNQINQGIDANFDPNGAMNFTIRNSELGADPEFLALMHKLGAAVKQDNVPGAAAGAGAPTGDGNSFVGISALW